MFGKSVEKYKIPRELLCIGKRKQKRSGNAPYAACPCAKEIIAMLAAKQGTGFALGEVRCTFNDRIYTESLVPIACIAEAANGMHPDVDIIHNKRPVIQNYFYSVAFGKLLAHAAGIMLAGSMLFGYFFRARLPATPEILNKAKEFFESVEGAGLEKPFKYIVGGAIVALVISLFSKLNNEFFTGKITICRNALLEILKDAKPPASDGLGA